jgi:hypothetical protein
MSSDEFHPVSAAPEEWIYSVAGTAARRSRPAMMPTTFILAARQAGPDQHPLTFMSFASPHPPIIVPANATGATMT